MSIKRLSIYEDETEFYLRFLGRQAQRSDPDISPVARDYFSECMRILKSRDKNIPIG